MILKIIGHRLRVRILKYRQGGVTTLFCILYLDEALWTPGFTAAIIAHEREALDKIFEIVDRAYENLPESVKPKTERNTLRMLRFKHAFDGALLDSQIYVALKLRGGTVSALHISERAYIEGEKSQELEAGSKQAVPLTGMITEETTANGLNEFHDSFTEDWDSPSDNPLDYLSVFYPWHLDPGYWLPGKIDEYTDGDRELKRTILEAYDYEISDGQILWYNWKMKDLVKAARESDDAINLSGRQLMKQEYPSTMRESFQSGAGSVFDPDLIQAHRPAVALRLQTSTKVSGVRFTIFKDVVPGKFYAIGGDPSDGVSDPAGIAVWDDNYEKVAEWSGLLRPDKLAELAEEMARYYNDAFAGIENNMLSTVLFMQKTYANLYSTVTVDKRFNTQTKKIGWTTTGQSRDILIDDFIMHFEEGTLKGLSAKSLKEMSTFIVKEGGKREHAVGKHDDMLFADMIAIQMIKHKAKSGGGRVFAAKPQGF